jgi:transcriptional regulator PpsR
MKEVSRQPSTTDALQSDTAFTRPFKSPDKSIGQLDPDSVARIMAAAADVSLVVDAEGVIRDLAFGSADLAREGYDQWVGQLWAQTVTIESRPKVEAMLRDAATVAKQVRNADEAAPPARWRQVNHPSSRGSDVPMMYSALSMGSQGNVIAFGRDLRATAELQQRLVDAQQAMERDYWRFRQAEARYRLLFEIASEAVLIIDPSTGRVSDANPAAQQLLENSSDKKLVGATFPQGFDEPSQIAVEALLQQVRASGQAAETQAKLLTANAETLRVAASLFRQQNTSLLVVRLTPLNAPIRLPSSMPSTLRPQQTASQQFAQSAPDAMVITNREGKIQWANQAFVQLVHCDRTDQVVGDTLDRWLGRTGVDLSVLISNLRQRGAVKLFATTVTVDHNLPTEVEISAVMLPHNAESSDESFGFTLRDVSRRLPSENTAQPSKELPRSVGQLAELVGRTPMKEIVSETTDLIEKLCIEAALELTGDNRAQAAEMLGLSRQSLYVKMRRFGVGDLSEV